eukprot:g5721.t1
MLDFGFPQTTSTEQLKLCVHNEAASVGGDGAGTATGGGGATGGALKASSVLPNLTARTVPSNAVHRPVGPTQDKTMVQKNEIFVDILERVTVLLNAQGQVLNACVDGSIQMKSYLSGNPELKLALNEDITILGNGGNPAAAHASVVLDDCNFHECVDLRDFDDQRILSFYPPDGEFAVMNYRITNDLRVPFRLFPRVTWAEKENTSTYTSAELLITARAELPDANYGGNVQISCQLPRNLVSSISMTEVFSAALGGSSSGAGPPTMGGTGQLHQGGAPSTATDAKCVEFLPAENRLVWHVKRFQGGSEFTLKTRLNFQQAVTGGKPSSIGPISLNFEIPMFSLSKIGVRYLMTGPTGK